MDDAMAECSQNASPTEAIVANGGLQPQLPLLPSIQKIPVAVEVCLQSSSSARAEDVHVAVQRMLEKRSLTYSDGPVTIPTDDPFLLENVRSIYICDTDGRVDNHEIHLFWQVTPVVHVYQLNEEGPGEELEGEDSISSFQEWLLPAKEFDGLWASLIYDTGLKQRLLRYAASALLFSEKGVNPCLISWNRVILLHGPPGTGKTSLCKALAQKLSIRLNSRYSHSQLVEVNAHSLFSKWFSESGKLVTKLFQKIHEMLEEENSLLFVLIDEVESLAAARQAALSGSEPSDSIRVVNALLTQLDRLKSWPNVVVLTTSNLTSAIDIAFVDRADIKAYVGPPTLQARYEILRSCLLELIRAGIVVSSENNEVQLLSYANLQHCITTDGLNQVDNSLSSSKRLLEAAEASEGLSGRALRKLPFLAHASLVNCFSCDSARFIATLVDTARNELSEQTG
ncbi:pachytene checkpoint protein 2 homolog isoform X1 [Cryptomeria japonica]|uniref:pachytene checkpoint protein 2 homolog isoform X1 n=2 Tax=Cryptomeria japonica TaxID=3369 RepID=UPI0027DA43E5|nr:pachytene checkpoint protein 2 homolog isoform X1 [Cryptomeria japonica]